MSSEALVAVVPQTPKDKPFSLNLRTALLLLGYGICFALAYSQQAVFFGNQNTKFITGLAAAGYGDLAADWMAGISDPFPLFSLLLFWQYSIFGLQLGIYPAFMLITAAYGLIALAGARCAGEGRSRAVRPLVIFAVLWLVLHTAGLRFLVNQVFPPGLGVQYLLGYDYQPCIFGVFLLAAIFLYLAGHFRKAIVLLALAPLFHPAYILIALLLGIFLTWLPVKENQKSPRRWPYLLGLLSFLSVYATWLLGRMTQGSEVVRNQAHQLLVNFRIPHHAVPSVWSLRHTLTFFAVGLLACLLYGRRSRLSRLLAAMLLVCGLAVIWGYLGMPATLAALTPWRLSVIAGPLSWIMLLMVGSRFIDRRLGPRFKLSARSARIAVGLIVLVAVTCGIRNFVLAQKRRRQASYVGVSSYIKNHHRSGYLYLIPPREMHLRLAAGVPVVVTRKSHPTRDDEFLAWYRRLQDVQDFYDSGGATFGSRLATIIKRYRVTHLVVPAEHNRKYLLTPWRRLYSDQRYILYELR
jgi:uncharacterized protein DUF6798